MFYVKLLATEAEETIALIDWAKHHPILQDIIVHIPNEAKRTPQLGRYLKRIGMRAGVSDILIPYPTQKYHGLWIEMKRKKKYTIKDEQRYWIDKMNQLGYLAVIALGFDDAKKIIEDYLR